MPRETILWFFVVPCGPLWSRETEFDPSPTSKSFSILAAVGEAVTSIKYPSLVGSCRTKALVWVANFKGPFELFMADQMIDLSWFLIRY